MVFKMVFKWFSFETPWRWPGIDSIVDNGMRKIRLRPALLGLFERKEIVHPFPSKHRSARRASTLLLTMECVGSVSLEFVLNKSDSDNENNSQHEK